MKNKLFFLLFLSAGLSPVVVLGQQQNELVVNRMLLPAKVVPMQQHDTARTSLRQADKSAKALVPVTEVILPEGGPVSRDKNGAWHISRTQRTPAASSKQHGIEQRTVRSKAK